MPYQQGYLPDGLDGGADNGANGYGYGHGQASPAQIYQRSGPLQPNTQQQPRHEVQQAPQYYPTSLHPGQHYVGQYQTHAVNQPQNYRPLYQPVRPQSSSAPGTQQVQYQQPYYQQQVVQTPPAHGYYQQSVGHVPPVPSALHTQRSSHQASQSQYFTPPTQPYPQSGPSPLPQTVGSQQSSPHSGGLSKARSHRRQHPQALSSGTFEPASTPAHVAPTYAPITSTPSHQRVVAQVRIPVHQHTSSQSDSHMHHPAKRRRSNGGDAIAVCDAPVPTKPSVPERPKPAPPPSSPLTELPSSQMPSTPRPEVDYQAVLLSLSDEYVGAAYGMSASLAMPNASFEELEQYRGLMTAGMACLESVLKNYRLTDSRLEARVRLRLATLLHEETENVVEAEEVLSKGISICDRSRLTDLKYAMQHLHVRILAKTSLKAAVKATNKLAAEVESLKLVHWVYVFHFLRVTLSLQHGNLADSAAILKHLTAISTVADDMRHVPVQVMTAILEASLHLRVGGTDAVEHTQRALAAARTHQLSEQIQTMPQIRALVDCLDLACALVQSSREQVPIKLKQLQATLDTTARELGWNKDGSFLLPLGIHGPSDLPADTGGIFKFTQNGETALALLWLTRPQLFTLGFVMSGIATMYNNHSDPKAETYLTSGLKLIANVPDPLQQSLPAATARIEWQAEISIQLRLQIAFSCAARYDWTSVAKHLLQVRKDLEDTVVPLNESTKITLLFLEATSKHGAGDLEAAATSYAAEELAFPLAAKDSSAIHDIQTIATLNHVLILRALDQEEQVNILLARVEGYCLNHKNRAMTAAFHTLKAMTQAESAIIKTKQYLQSAMGAAKTSANNQMQSIILNIMTKKYFHGIVGEQALKSARVSRSLAVKAQDKMWTATADGMMAEHLDLTGEHEQAQAFRLDAIQMMQGLPCAVKEHFEQR